MNVVPEHKDLTIFGMPAVKGRWLFVAIGLVVNLCLGTIYSWSVFVQPLTDYFTRDLGTPVTASEILLPFSVFLAFFAIAMGFAGKYVEELGPRKTTVIGGILTGLGWLLASMVTSVTQLYFVYGVIGGIGVGLVYGVPVALAARWFPDRRGLAVGLALLGFGFSAFITANIAGYLIEAAPGGLGLGVMNTFRVFGIAFIVIIAILALPLRFPPLNWRPPGWSPPPAQVCGLDLTRKEMVRTGSFYALWICYFIGCLAGLMAISIAKPVGTEIAHIGSGLATMLVGVFAIFNGGGRPLFGSLTDRLQPRNTAVLSFVLIAGASLLMFLAADAWAYILSFAILWGCLGGWLAIAPTSCASFFGTCDYPRCYGILFLAYGAGAIAGPQLAGFIRTSTGSYSGVFPYVAVLAIAGLVIAHFFMKPPAPAPGR